MGRHSVSSQRLFGALTVAAAVVLVLAGVLYVVLRQETSAQDSFATSASTGVAATAAVCPTSVSPVSVAVAPAAVDVVKAAAARVTAASLCDAVTVTAAEPADVAASFTGGAPGKTPAGWVSDSSVFVDAVRAAKPDALASDVQSVATSPLVFAVPRAVAAKVGAALANPSWGAIVTGDGTVPVRLTDPERTTSGRLVLLNAPTALGTGAAARTAMGRALLVWSHSPMPKEQDLFAAATTDRAGVFATSEQAVAAYLRKYPGALVAAVPAEGTGRYDYTLVTATGIPASYAATLAALRTQLTNDLGREDLVKAGFRVSGSDRGPGVPGMPTGAVKYLPDPPAAQQAALVKTWAGVKTDARMLALIDTSGSMKEMEGDKTRMQLAGEAAQVAVTVFPNSSQLGLWTFGIDKGGPGQDWREVVPIRQLDADAGGVSQRQALSASLPGLVSSAGGGTGLYDTLLAAYQHMVSSYAPGRVNSVILLTDGRNEKPGGLTLEQLLARITQVKDPARPVVIVTVGMGRGVDTAALAAVAGVTGGKSYQALDPQDIKQVFIDALLSRDCTGGICTSH